MSKVYALLVVVLLALTPCWLHAQQPLPATTAASPTAVPLADLPAAPDTVAALHRLFALRRERGYTAFKVGGAMLAVGAGTVAIVGNDFNYKTVFVFLGGVVCLGSSVPVLASGVIRTIIYSEKRQKRAIQAWQQHRMSRHLKRALEDDSLLTAQARLAQAAALAALGPVAATPAAIDTAAALHQLFVSKRRLLRAMLPLTTVVGAGCAVKIATPAPSYGSAIGATTLLVLAGEVAILKRYSKKNEALALLALKEHRLPATQLQELKVEYFRPSKATP